MRPSSPVTATSKPTASDSPPLSGTSSQRKRTTLWCASTPSRSSRKTWPGTCACAAPLSPAIGSSPAARPPVGALLREWRQRRRLSQFELALDTGVSTRHLSFVETGRSRPSAQLLLHLAEQLDVPLRERNRLLLAAGYAPAYGQRDLD